MGTISGSCFCQAIKYELTSESQLQGLCYCTDCQRVGGSAHWTSYAVAPADFRLREGTLTPYTYDPGSGREVTRHFCGKCGTQIMVQSDALDVTSVNAMTFDDASVFKPEIGYFTTSAPAWCEVDKGLRPFGAK